MAHSITIQEVKTEQLKAKSANVRNIRAAELISGDCLSQNLIRNSYMNLLDGSKPAGYNVSSTLTLEAVHPFTKRFERPSVEQQPSNAASSVDEANEVLLSGLVCTTKEHEPAGVV